MTKTWCCGATQKENSLCYVGQLSIMLFLSLVSTFNCVFNFSCFAFLFRFRCPTNSVMTGLCGSQYTVQSVLFMGVTAPTCSLFPDSGGLVPLRLIVVLFSSFQEMTPYKELLSSLGVGKAKEEESDE